MIRVCTAFLVTIFLVSGVRASAEEREKNWSLSDRPCSEAPELLKRSQMNIGVRVLTSNPVLAVQFKRAMNFWANVLALDWHEEDTDQCAIQVADGDKKLFDFDPDNMVARAQLPDRDGFYGSIVFNPDVALTAEESYRVSIHEIGHLLGLSHNPSSRSLMYQFELDRSNALDSYDLKTLSARHQLRGTPLRVQLVMTSGEALEIPLNLKGNHSQRR